MQIPLIVRALVLIISIFLFGKSSFSQKTELSMNAYTAIFGFLGNGTTASSDINASHITPEVSTINFYGKNGSFSYALELQAQRVTKQKFIYGIGTAFEVLNSKVKIDTIRINEFDHYYSAEGNTIFKNSYLTLNPYFGKRILMSKITMDVLLGMDIGFILKSQEKVKARIEGTKDYETFENQHDMPLIDYRTRAQVKVQYKRTGFILGYSLGLTNYIEEPGYKANTSILRLGIGYTLK